MNQNQKETRKRIEREASNILSEMLAAMTPERLAELDRIFSPENTPKK